MNDLETIKLIIDCNKETKEDFSKRFDDYNRSMSLLITSEVSDIKDDIKDLTKQVSIQNGTVRNIAEWRVDASKDILGLKSVNDERRKNRRSNTLFFIGQIVFIIMVALGWYFTSKKVSNTEREVKKVLVEIKK
jgi:hypothetical protein